MRAVTVQFQLGKEVQEKTVGIGAVVNISIPSNNIFGWGGGGFAKLNNKGSKLLVGSKLNP